jgi:hypothetical protein
MDTILLILGILGFGAIVISIYVFTVAARNYVSDTHEDENQAGRSAENNFIERSSNDRRKNFQLDFPMTVNGMLITMERRTILDRRCAPG